MTAINNVIRSNIQLMLVTLCFYSPIAFSACGDSGASEGKYCLLSDLGGCTKLTSFLADKLDPLGNNGLFTGTLIIDEQCKLSGPIVLPRRMTLAGVGIGGEGSLVFENLEPNEPAISIQDDNENPMTGVDVTIRDLSVYGPDPVLNGGRYGIGIDLVNDSQVIIERVRISEFNIGIRGVNSFSVSIAHSNISSNNRNLLLRKLANTWRIRDNILSQSRKWSVIVNGSNGALFDGNRFESNQLGAIKINSAFVLLSNNRFEKNGFAENNEGIRIESGALDTRVLTNIFSASTLTNFGIGTHCGFNIIDLAPEYVFAC